MMIFYLILQALWLLLPAGFANMSPILAKKILPNWNTPVDFGIKIRGREILGSHKTYRGLLSGALVGMLIFYLQQLVYNQIEFFRTISMYDYSDVNPFFGAWIGFCALLGDIVKSFFKRRLQIAPGKPWIIFDEIDWIVGSLLGTCIVFVPSIKIIIACLITGTLLHFIIRLASYWLGWVSEPL